MRSGHRLRTTTKRLSRGRYGFRDKDSLVSKLPCQSLTAYLVAPLARFLVSSAMDEKATRPALWAQVITGILDTQHAHVPFYRHKLDIHV